MRRVYFYGKLAEKYGEMHKLAVDNVGALIRLMDANFPNEFIKDIKKGAYRVVMGKDIDTGHEMTEDMLVMRLGKKDLHIMPVLEGHGGGNKKGVFSVVLGVALVATAWTGVSAGLAAGVGGFGAPAFSVAGLSVSYGNIAMFGASLILQGVSSMLTPTPSVNDYSDRNTPDERPSFLFSGAVNVTEEGGPVPICYGRFGVGSVVVSGGIDAVQLPADG